MKESKTLLEALKIHEQTMLMKTLKLGDEAVMWDRGIRAVGPNDDFPLPWIIDRLPGTGACSIISVGGKVHETVVSMIDCDSGAQVIEEVNE